MTPYESIHGQGSKGTHCEFGEQVFYHVHKKLRAKLNLRFRLGTFLGSSQSSNEAYIATSAGDAIRSRSIVRVVAPNRWSKDAIAAIKGTPHQPKPFGPVELSELVEEAAEPHANADDPDAARIDAEILVDGPNVQKLDKQLRITLRDLHEFGFSDGCPRCAALQDGQFSTKKMHSQECRLRIYLHYKESDHVKWRAVKHLLEPDDKFSDAHVDLEGAHAAPKAQNGSNALDAHATGRGGEEIVPPPSPVHDGRDEESILADAAAAVAFADDVPEMPEDELAEMFEAMDVDGNESAAVAENQMIDTLIMAGLTKEHARETAKSFQTNTPPATFMEVYGRSIRDYSLVTRRNFNVAGLDALDLRTVKPNGEPWDFMERADRHEARRLVRERKPAWVIGAPPCAAFSIWIYAMNYPKMNPDVVREKLAEGGLHLQFVASLYRIQDADRRYDLHEHPATAMSWKEDVITALARRPNARLVIADQCQTFAILGPDIGRRRTPSHVQCSECS